MHVDQPELRTKVPCLESRFLLANTKSDKKTNEITHQPSLWPGLESGFLLVNTKSDKKIK